MGLYFWDRCLWQVFLFFDKLAPLLFFHFKKIHELFSNLIFIVFSLLTITTVETWWFSIEFGFIFPRSHERTFWFLFLKWSCWLLSGIKEGQEWKPGYQVRDYCRNSGERWWWLGQSGNSEHWKEWMVPRYVSETWWDLLMDWTEVVVTEKEKSRRAPRLLLKQPGNVQPH